MAKRAQAQAGDMSRLEMSFDKPHLINSVFGEFDRNLVTIENRLGVYISARGNRVQIEGEAGAIGRTRDILNDIYSRVVRGEIIDQEAVQAIIAMTAEPTLEGIVRKETDAPGIMIRTRKKTLVPRSANQVPYMEALARDEIIFALGPAGTGKTYLAVAQAVAMLITGAVQRLVLSRPAVEAGERLGFLPGDMKEKVDPYLRPLYDALYDMMPAEKVERGLQSGMIEVAPLAFMRGRTLSNAVVLLDEAQNCTAMQMKMFLTRLGENSKMIVTGDPTQVDLPPGTRSGLVDALEILTGVDGMVRVNFTEKDVVRHELVARIVKAYDDASREKLAAERESRERWAAERAERERAGTGRVENERELRDKYGIVPPGGDRP
jgi:phosphate starvation-inducible PhoH-like protein